MSIWTVSDATTVRRLLVRIAPLALRQLRELHDSLLRDMVGRPQAPTRLIFDLDSTVLVVCGKQRQAKHKILLMPAELRRTHNYPALALPASGNREAAWKYALPQINKLKP